MNEIKRQNLSEPVQSSSDFTDDQTTTTLCLLPLYQPNLHLQQGKMKAYSLISYFHLLCICRYTSVDIMPELKRNILNFGYGINFKYEGMLSHSFERFYVVTKFILPTVDDLKFSPIDFNSECSYINGDIRRHQNAAQYLPNIKNFCTKIVPFIDFYKKQIGYYNKTVHDILTKEIPLILPNFPKNRKEKRHIIASLVTGFMGLVYEGISSYLHNKRQKALKKAFMAMENQVNLKRNKILLGRFNGNVWHL